MRSPAHHATLIFERVCEAPVETVFAAFADAKARARWGKPWDAAAMHYEEANFRVGGRDVFRCGPKSAPLFRGETRYLDIVPNHRIVSSVTTEIDGKRLSTVLNTVELEPADTSTYVSLTVQLAALDGPDLIERSRAAYDAALDNLVAYTRRGTVLDEVR